MTWILILFFLTADTSVIKTIEYDSQAACENAKRLVQMELRGKSAFDTVCTPKGDVWK